MTITTNNVTIIRLYALIQYVSRVFLFRHLPSHYRVSTAQVLLDSGANVHAIDKKGATPSHIASKTRQVYKYFLSRRSLLCFLCVIFKKKIFANHPNGHHHIK